MVLPIYPGQRLLPGLSYGVKWNPVFFNLPTQTAVSGADIDLMIAQYPLHDFELSYEMLRDFAPGRGWAPPTDLEFKTLMGFHLMIGGTVGRFLFKNPDDYRVWRQRIGVGDGVSTVFTLTRTFGAQGFYGTEPVGQVDTAAGFNAYLNGSATPVDPTAYVISTTTPCLNTITFTTPPPNTQVIEVDMCYYYYCKLPDNANSFEKFMDRLWQLNKITLHSCRAGA